ncbi:FAD-binding oxidoreductase [bacterium]|nr:FAD-binding oxidoreductase [bacterium]
MPRLYPDRVDRDFEFAVVGQGLAGTAVAWQLRRRRRRFLVIDRGDPHAASRVAAGLITPYTGRRIARTWKLDECFGAAVAVYGASEAETGVKLLHHAPALRLFADAAERDVARGKIDPTRFDRAINRDWFAAPHGGFDLTPAARLDTTRFLDAYRTLFAEQHAYRVMDFDPATDVEPTADSVRLPRLGLTVRGVFFCQGVGGVGNPWFPTVPYNPAKGEVLTLRIPGLGETRPVHRGVWLAPVGGDTFLAGSTYDRADHTPTPTAAGRAAIEAGLREFLKLPFEVLDHRAGVRPVLLTTKPMLGVHPRWPGLAILTGLGSKGSLYAPVFAAQLVDHVIDGRPLDADVRLA